MKYTNDIALKMDVQAVARGHTLSQRQDSVGDQLADLAVLANRFGMRDAADLITELHLRRLQNLTPDNE